MIGTGYLGATHAVCMARLGCDVVGVDTDECKIRCLNAGKAPFYEPGLDELLRGCRASGRLRFTTSYEEAALSADVHFICVGTPQKCGEYGADLSCVDTDIKDLSQYLDRRTLVVGKSTVPAGTAARIAVELRRLSPAGSEVELAWNPEFQRERFAVDDALRPDRLVFGVQSDWAEDQLRAAFAPVIAEGCPVIVTDYATAELAKVAANSFLATKISFINAMADVCEVVGADVTRLADALGHDNRIGRDFLNAGLGFGGGCLPKDLRAFIARAEELGADDQSLTLLKSVDAINVRRRARTVDLAREMLNGSFCGTKVAALGAAFKPNSDDVRDSPALDVATCVARQGAKVTIYDPAAVTNARREQPGLTYAGSAFEACRDVDLVIVLTEWNEFREMKPRGSR